MEKVRLHLTHAQEMFEPEPLTKVIEISLPRVPVPDDKIILPGKGDLPTCFWVSDVYFNATPDHSFVATCFLYEGGIKSTHADLVGETGGTCGFSTTDLFPAGYAEAGTVGDFISKLACYPRDMRIYADDVYGAFEEKASGLGLSVQGNDLFISVEPEDK